MSKNSDYTTGNLLDNDFSKHYRLIAIDLSKQIELRNPKNNKLTLLVSLKVMEQCFS